MKIAIGSDHAGVEHKQALKELAASMGMEVADMGTGSSQSVDYPDYGEKVGLAVSSGASDLGILICGTGIGIGMARQCWPGSIIMPISCVWEPGLFP